MTYLGERKAGSRREPYRWSVIDYNNDGRADIVTWHHSAADARHFNIYLSRPNANGEWRLSPTPIVVAQGAVTDEHHLFVDINGDGLVDAISPAGYWLLERDTSQSKTSERPYRFGTKNNLDWFLTHSSGVRCVDQVERKFHDFGDFNGDGVVDVIASEYLASDYSHKYPECRPGFYKAYVMNRVAGHRLVPRYSALESPSGSPGKDDLIRSPDLNGDGLADLFFQVGNKYYYQINNGDGFEPATRFVPNGSKSDNFQFVDYNNDGYTDIAYYDGSSGHYVALWTGSGFSTTHIRYHSAQLRENEEYTLVDISNDGQLDLLHLHGREGRLLPSASQGEASNVVTAITNGLGSKTRVEYEPINHSAHYRQVGQQCSVAAPCNGPINTNELRQRMLDPNRLPTGSHSFGLLAPVMEVNGPLYVVTQVTGAMPTAGSAPRDVDQGGTSTIAYYYGEAYAQAGGRGFLGFRDLTTRDLQTGVTTKTEYLLEFPYIGSPLKTEVRTSSGALLSTSENTWKQQNWTSTAGELIRNGGSKAFAPYKPYIATATERTFSTTTDRGKHGGLTVGTTEQKRITTSTLYDTYGNVTRLTETVTGGGATFITDTVNSYGTSAYEKEMGRLSRAQVAHTRTEAGVANTITRTSAFTYYHNSGSSSCYSAALALDGMLCEEIIEPDDPNYTLTTTHYYDDLGNKIRVTQQGQGSVVRQSRWEYDAAGRYVDRSYNSLDQLTESVISRNNLGLPTKVSGVNGLVQDITYDGLGRERSRSDSTGASLQTTITSCRAGCPVGAVFAVERREATGARSRIYYDQLARVIREGQLAFNGTWTYTDSEYDQLGRVKRKSDAFYEAQTTVGWYDYEYDILGRVIKTQMPDQSVNITHYQNLTTVLTNALGQSKNEVRNVRGELIAAVDEQGTALTYRYDPQGNLVQVDTHNRSDLRITLSYDRLGRKVAMQDPDKGAWSYSYNIFGELTGQVDAKGQTVQNEYDPLGRLTRRTHRTADSNVDAHTRWYYDTTDDQGTAANNAITLPTAVVQSRNVAHEICSAATAEYCERYEYDSLGRLITTHTLLGRNGETGAYKAVVSYDNLGRILTERDALGGALESQPGGSNTSGTRNIYNNTGYLERVEDIATGDLLYRLLSTNARGQVTSEQSANGAITQYAYDTDTGLLKNQRAALGGIFFIQDISYEWDDIGNLSSRRNNSTNPLSGQAQDLKESFCYDRMNRLIKTTRGTTSFNCAQLPVASQDIRYDEVGNIVFKSDVGNYTYGQGNAGPHAVTYTSDGVSYSYDANGNMISDTSGRSLAYTSMDKPYRISKGNHRIEFSYGPSGDRYLRIDTNTSSGEVRTTQYLGNVERITRSAQPDVIEWKRYLPGGAVYTVTTTTSGGKVNSTSTDKIVLYKDHLGSTDVITNKLGEVIHAFSFDPWGERRDPWTWENFDPGTLLTYTASLFHQLGASATTRGFTGHEMLDEVGLVHMNGRIYDPRLARFVQADPIVQTASDTQLFNRYSYTRNNPLNATDPSGYVIASIVGIFAYAMYAVGSISEIWVVWTAIAAATAIEVLANGGDVGQALAAAFTSFAISNMGSSVAEQFGGNLFSHVISQGIVGGIGATLNGGRFGHGFRAAGLSTLVGGWQNPKATGWAAAGQKAARIIVGGTISKASGGKFANGATTAAFAAIVSDAAQLSVSTDTATEVNRLDQIPDDPQSVYDDAFSTVSNNPYVDKGKTTQFVNGIRVRQCLDSDCNRNRLGPTFDSVTEAKTFLAEHPNYTIVDAITVDRAHVFVYRTATAPRRYLIDDELGIARANAGRGSRTLNLSGAENVIRVLAHEGVHVTNPRIPHGETFKSTERKAVEFYRR